MSKLEDTARGILETLLKKRISDQAWDRDRKKMQLLGIPLDQSGVRLYVTLKSHITQNLDKIIGVQNIPNRQMSGREIIEDMESRKWMPKSFSTFQRWFEDGFSVRKTYGELEVTLAYLKAFIYQKKHNRLPKQLGGSNDN
ncbi:MAG: hypothetical protein ACO3YZ_05080 [Candidatus Nanopelagicaceae bacterium]